MGAFIQTTVSNNNSGTNTTGKSKTNAMNTQEIINKNTSIEGVSQVVLGKIQNICGIGEKEFSKLVKQAGNITKLTDSIIAFDPNNIELAKMLLRLNFDENIVKYSKASKKVLQDKSVLTVLLNFDNSVYLHPDIQENIDKILVKDLENNKHIAKLTLRNFIKLGVNLDHIDIFIDKIAGKSDEKKKILESIYKQELQLAGKNKISDLQKDGLALKMSDPELWIKLCEYKILSEKNGEVNKAKIKALSQEINKAIKEETIQNSSDAITEYIFEKIGLKKTILEKQQVKEFFISLQGLLTITVIAPEIVAEKNDQESKQKEGEDKSISSSSDKGVSSSINTQNLVYISENFSLSHSAAGISVSDGNINIEMTEAEFNRFTSIGLERYLKFQFVLIQCGLGFFIQSRNESGVQKFFTNNLEGFNMYSGGGFSDHYVLEALNLIAHLINIPKKHYGDNGELGKFKNIKDAKDAFQTIHETGKINDEQVVRPGMLQLGNGASEAKLKKLEVLDKNGIFSIEQANKVLDEGHEQVEAEIKNKKREEKKREVNDGIEYKKADGWGGNDSKKSVVNESSESSGNKLLQTLGINVDGRCDEKKTAIEDTTTKQKTTGILEEG